MKMAVLELLKGKWFPSNELLWGESYSLMWNRVTLVGSYSLRTLRVAEKTTFDLRK